MAEKPHPTPTHHRVQRIRDDEGRVTCFACSHVFDEGRAGVSLSSRYLSHGTVHKVVEMEPAEDDEVSA